MPFERTEAGRNTVFGGLGHFVGFRGARSRFSSITAACLFCLVPAHAIYIWSPVAVVGLWPASTPFMIIGGGAGR